MEVQNQLYTMSHSQNIRGCHPKIFSNLQTQQSKKTQSCVIMLHLKSVLSNYITWKIIVIKKCPGNPISCRKEESLRHTPQHDAHEIKSWMKCMHAGTITISLRKREAQNTIKFLISLYVPWTTSTVELAEIAKSNQIWWAYL